MVTLVHRMRLFGLVALSLVSLAAANLSSQVAYGQPEKAETVRGTVVNSVTREPISRALVSSPDNRFATMTDSQGHFEFTFSKTDNTKQSDAGGGGGEVPTNGSGLMTQPIVVNRPDVLVARKPGFLTDQDNVQNLHLYPAGKEVTIPLVPEAVIAGTVSLPTTEAPDRIQLQIFRRQVQDGLARWIPAGGTTTRADGEFRFADLPAGTYKLLTRELLDRDPQTFDPTGPTYGYPPVYYSDASDFASASTLQLSAGETAQPHLSLVKQRYHQVKVPVTNAAPGAGINVEVYLQGGKGPGYSLGYDNRDQTIQGMLPDGTYTIEASSYARHTPGGPAEGLTGLVSLTVKGATTEGPRMTLVPNSPIRVDVKEEFASDDHSGSMTWNLGNRQFAVKGPRRYLNLVLEPADDFGRGGGNAPRGPTGPGDDALVFENVQPGRYWLRITSSRGYAASARSGATDLLRQPLVVGLGGSVAPIEITMRDDTGEIDGTIDGITAPENTGISGTDGISVGSGPVAVPPAPAHVYCVPLPDSGGTFGEVWVAPDGSFISPPLPPGAYRLLAFDQAQRDLEFRNPEAMRAYDTKGPVVRLVAGQKEHVQLQLIAANK